jgi:hypothetical protein
MDLIVWGRLSMEDPLRSRIMVEDDAYGRWEAATR